MGGGAGFAAGAWEIADEEQPIEDAMTASLRTDRAAVAWAFNRMGGGIVARSHGLLE